MHVNVHVDFITTGLCVQCSVTLHYMIPDNRVSGTGLTLKGAVETVISCHTNIYKKETSALILLWMGVTEAGCSGMLQVHRHKTNANRSGHS